MAQTLNDKQRLEQLQEWGLDLSRKENQKVAEFLISHWEDVLEILDAMDKQPYSSLFKFVMPVIGKHITEKNWLDVKKGLISLAKTADSAIWSEFYALNRVMDERTLPYLLELSAKLSFLKHAKYINMLPEEHVRDIKNYLSPEMVKILELLGYVPEALLLFPFMKNLLKLFLQHNINMVYAIDKSARILGFLFFCVVSNLGLSKQAKFYFMNVPSVSGGGKEGQLYSEKQKKELYGKNVLLIDEYVSSGKTIAAAYKLLSSLVGPTGKVIPTAYSVKLSELSDVKNIQAQYYRLKEYHAVAWQQPRWYGNIGFAGVEETLEGFVEISDKARPFAIKARNDLSKYAKIIAACLKESMQI